MKEINMVNKQFSKINDVRESSGTNSTLLRRNMKQLDSKNVVVEVAYTNTFIDLLYLKKYVLQRK